VARDLKIVMRITFTEFIIQNYLALGFRGFPGIGCRQPGSIQRAYGQRSGKNGHKCPYSKALNGKLKDNNGMR